MPIIEQYESRGLSQTYGQETRFYICVIDSGDPDVAGADPDLPNIGDEWPIGPDPDLICVDRNVLRIAPTYSHCIATFAERVQEERFSCPTEQVTVLVTLDPDGGGVRRAIGPFINKQAQGADVLRSTYKTLQITRWETDFEEAALAYMIGKVNDKRWRGWFGTTDHPEAVTGHWLIADISIVSTRPLTFGAPGPVLTGQLAQISYTFLLSTAIVSPEIDGWGPGWLWTWYNRDHGSEALIPGAKLARVYEATDFDVLDLDPIP